MEHNDADAVRRTLAGDREAFARLVERYSAPLSAFAYDRLGSAVEAQDAVQEALVTAYDRLDTLADPARFASWAYGIVRNVCAMRQRRRNVEQRSTERLADARAGRGALTPLEKLEQGERASEIRKAVEALSPVLREAVVLRYIGGVDRQRAAAVLEISLDALDKRLERALRELRERLDKV